MGKGNNKRRKAARATQEKATAKQERKKRVKENLENQQIRDINSTKQKTTLLISWASAALCLILGIILGYISADEKSDSCHEDIQRMIERELNTTELNLDPVDRERLTTILEICETLGQRSEEEVYILSNNPN